MIGYIVGITRTTQLLQEDSIMAMYSVVKTTDAVLTEGMTAYSVSRTDGKKGKSGIVCVAPSISDAVTTVFYNDAMGKAFIVDVLESLRSKIISKLHADGKVISDESIGITAMLTTAKLLVEGSRMTKEAIGVWFDADMATLITARIKEKMAGISEDKVAKLVAGYRVAFESLSAREVGMSEEVKASLLKAMDLLPEDYDSVMGGKVLAKLVAAEEPKEILAAL
jgi:hypothetical protein